MFLSATIRLTSCRSCFASLSPDLIQKLPSFSKRPGNMIVFQLDWDGGTAFLTWSGETAISRSLGFNQTQEPIVEIGKRFGDINGLTMGQQVVLTPLENVPSCNTIHVDPVSANDWEILELHSGFIESNLLNQIRVVWVTEVIPVWINQSTSIAIQIGKHEPEGACVLLEEYTEVIVAPKLRTNKELSTSQTKHGLQANQELKTNEKTLEEDVSLSSTIYNIWNYFFHNGESISNSRQDVLLESEPNSITNITSMQHIDSLQLMLTQIELLLYLRSQDEFYPQHLNEKVKMQSQHISCVFVNPYTMQLLNHKACKHLSIGDFDGLCKTVKLKRLLSPNEKNELLNIEKRNNANDKDSNTTNYIQESFVKDVAVKMVLSQNVLPGNIILHKQLLKQLGVSGLSCFQVTHIPHDPEAIQGLILHPLSASEKEDESGYHQLILDSFYKMVNVISSKDNPFQIWSGIILKLDCNGEELEVIITVLSHAEEGNKDDPHFYLLNTRVLQDITVVVGEIKSKNSSLLWEIQHNNSANLTCTIDDLGGVSQPFYKCLNHLLVCLGQSPLSTCRSNSLTKGLCNGAILIYGSGQQAGEGCGKTSLGHALCNKLRKLPICAHVVYIDCIPLRGKRVETIQKHWHQAFLDAVWHQPSVILLDNLDHVISAPSLGQEMGSEGLYRNRLVQVFKDLIASEVANQSTIAVMATSRSLDSLHGDLRSSHGMHVFQCCVQLGPLNKHQRYQVLLKLIKRKIPEISHDQIESLIMSIINKCEGFSPKDLNAVAERAMHFALVRTSFGVQETLDSDDFKQALSGYQPASLRGIQLHKPDQQTWNDVGGLKQVKKLLEESLLWPTKYANLFAKCPIRLRSGLLLYGPPGTGKTLLAGVTAFESGLNFISIKGPELLSKYIGASEQAARDVFSRAQSAKPCILFFDEFDALAPRRGHDSTGVTDRVVNQLLTQLDGFEGLEGVFILAATSRPGLIDPALLRPGRLDKCVYCPMPNEIDRLEIFKSMTKSIELDENVDLLLIAEQTEHFTGADLKALLYNAQLECIHRTTSTLKLFGDLFDDTNNENLVNKGEDIKQDVIIISQSDLEKALSAMKPSVSANERQNYEDLFESFTRSKGNSFTKHTQTKGKATLA